MWYITLMNIAFFSALAEPNRFQIIELLRDKPRPVGEIAEALHIRQPQASKHLRVLADAGIVGVHQNAQQRIYSLQPQPFHELASWLDTYQNLWNEHLDRMEDYIYALQGKGKKQNGSK